MTNKTFRKKVFKLGGKISRLGEVTFPHSFCIKTKSEAIDLLDVLVNDPPEGSLYAIHVGVPCRALKAAIIQGALA